MAQPKQSSGATYGALQKINYANLPPSNPQIAWDNTLLGPAVCDIAALGLTRFQAVLQVTLAATVGALVLNSWNAVWKNATPVAPVMAKLGTGIFTFTFPTIVSDEYSQSVGNPAIYNVNFTGGCGNIEGTTFGFINVSAVNNVITVNIGNSGGSANNLVGSIVDIYAY